MTLKLKKSFIAKPGPAFPLGQLGNCLRPLNGRGAPNFRKEGVEGKKKMISDESKKKSDTSFWPKNKISVIFG